MLPEAHSYWYKVNQTNERKRQSIYSHSMNPPESTLLTSKLRGRDTFQHDTFPPAQGLPTALGLTLEFGNVALLTEVISRKNLMDRSCMFLSLFTLFWMTTCINYWRVGHVGHDQPRKRGRGDCEGPSPHSAQPVCPGPEMQQEWGDCVCMWAGKWLGRPCLDKQTLPCQGRWANCDCQS